MIDDVFIDCDMWSLGHLINIGSLEYRVTAPAAFTPSSMIKCRDDAPMNRCADDPTNPQILDHR
jgi:hypothetical protein